MKAEIVGRTLGGRRVRRGGMAHCPAHDDREPSLSIKDADGKLLVHCHACCDQSRVIAELGSRGLWHESNGRAGKYSQLVPARTTCVQLAKNDSALNRRRAAALWQEATPIVATISAKYLATRGILHLAAGINGKVLRFHPSRPYGGSRHPCMLALMRDIHPEEPRAIQHTALTLAAEKSQDTAWLARQPEAA